MNSSAGVVLIGPRGAGKTTVGRRLAARLKMPFRDADAAVEEETGRTVQELLAARTFREHEATVTAGLLAGPPLVLAAGGGIVLWDGFADAAAHWRVVWLDAVATVLADRIAGSDRMSLTGTAPELEIGKIAKARAPLYAAVAEHRIDTSRDDSETVAKRIDELLRNEPQQRS